MFVSVLVLISAFGVIAGRYRGERSTPSGREVAARWLGVRDWLAGHDAFADLPPAAVMVWDRYLGYGAAVHVAHAATAALDLGMGSKYLVWSSYGGHWRRVRVRYPRLLGRYGLPTGKLVKGGLIRLALGFAAAAVSRTFPDVTPDRVRFARHLVGRRGPLDLRVTDPAVHGPAGHAADRLGPVPDRPRDHRPPDARGDHRRGAVDRGLALGVAGRGQPVGAVAAPFRGRRRHRGPDDGVGSAVGVVEPLVAGRRGAGRRAPVEPPGGLSHGGQRGGRPHAAPRLRHLGQHRQPGRWRRWASGRGRSRSRCATSRRRRC